LIDLKNSYKPLVYDYTHLAGNVFETTNGVIRCFSIYCKVPKTFIGHIIESVKTKIIESLIDIDEKFFE